MLVLNLLHSVQWRLHMPLGAKIAPFWDPFRPQIWTFAPEKCASLNIVILNFPTPDSRNDHGNNPNTFFFSPLRTRYCLRVSSFECPQNDRRTGLRYQPKMHDQSFVWQIIRWQSVSHSNCHSKVIRHCYGGNYPPTPYSRNHHQQVNHLYYSAQEKYFLLSTKSLVMNFETNTTTSSNRVETGERTPLLLLYSCEDYEDKSEPYFD